MQTYDDSNSKQMKMKWKRATMFQTKLKSLLLKSKIVGLKRPINLKELDLYLVVVLILP